ncbi:hypothetical protein Nepgr_017407 [Nepenthes gracilis]|uniref:Uncharacterized protein n=1 Tax=Nepenthes gracilis TaxID=150966 RepID=A0AAD3SRZ0_NEPGR|nr:hypothetical protein Nepgr_017407 [Nepenthes gracilis]
MTEAIHPIIKMKQQPLSGESKPKQLWAHAIAAHHPTATSDFNRDQPQEIPQDQQPAHETPITKTNRVIRLDQQFKVPIQGCSFARPWVLEADGLILLPAGELAAAWRILGKLVQNPTGWTIAVSCDGLNMLLQAAVLLILSAYLRDCASAAPFLIFVRIESWMFFLQKLMKGAAGGERYSCWCIVFPHLSVLLLFGGCWS